VPVRDPLALALCLGLLVAPLGALLARRGLRARGALVGAAAAGAGTALLDAALSVGAGGAGAALAAAAGALGALLLPGPMPGRSGFGRAFGRAAFAGTIGEALVPGRLAAATPSRLVDAADALRLERAVLDAEAKAEAELAVTLVRRCSAYGTAAWRAAAWLAALALAGAVAVAPSQPRWGLAAAAAGAALGLAGARAPRLRRLVVADAVLAERAEARALDAFARAGLGRAPGHAGILLFGALLEGRVLVLADRGLRAPARAWSEVASAAAEGLAGGVAPDGLERALERAGLLAAALRPRRTPGAMDGRPPPVFVED
jgi:uncharacterized membrane protein